MIAVAALPRPLRIKLMEVVGFDDPWSRDPTLVPDDARAYADELVVAVEQRLATNTTAYWCEALAAAGIPGGPMRLREQLIDDEQVLANNFVTRLEHDLVGGFTVVAPPVGFSDTPLSAARPSPVLGQHTAAILAEAGLDKRQIEALRTQRAIWTG
jgi:crotonobetainyl-CoA:carnitine CoA-transferase CaiB-like acyl-CoA transferase